MLLLDPPLASLASQQNGLLTAAQLRSHGMNRDSISRRARSWRPVLRGIYLVEARPIDEEVLSTAAALRWPTAAVSHETAARRRGWKLLEQRPDWDAWLPAEPAPERVIHLTSATQIRTPPPFRLHRADPGDCTFVGKTRVTNEARTLADIARTAPLPVAVCAIDAACHTDEKLLTDVRHELGKIAGQRGVARAERAIHLAHPGAASLLETLLRLLLVLAGLPQPQVQIPVRHPGGTYYGDLGYRERKLILEADGRDHHSEWSQVMKDMARQNFLVAAGWMVLRFSWRQVLYQPQLVVRTVAEALAR